MTEHLILRALLGLVRAQLRQRDYLTFGEATDLESVSKELRSALSQRDQCSRAYSESCEK